MSSIQAAFGGRSARAFTLIEVLMSVLILGVGLLGLASVLPAVLKQQWAAADAVQATLAAESAIAYVASSPTLASVEDTTYRPVQLNKRFWDIWAVPWIDPDTNDEWRRFPVPGDPALPPTVPPIFNPNQHIPRDGRWLPLPMDGSGLNYTTLGLDLTVNQDPVVTTAQYQQRSTFLPLADRLYPNDSSGARRPQFVYDLAVRRLAGEGRRLAGPPNFDHPPGFNKVQLAVFVRRIDPRLTIPRTQTLFQNLTDKFLTQPERRNPVSVDPNRNPSFDGRSDNGFEYSLPVTVAADFTPGFDPLGLEVRDVIQLTNPDPPERLRQASQPGQILVDNLGNIYKVLGLSDGSSGVFGIQVTPPVPFGVVGAGGNANQPRMRQVIFTPQIPAAVKLFEVNP